MPSMVAMDGYRFGWDLIACLFVGRMRGLHWSSRRSKKRPEEGQKTSWLKRQNSLINDYVVFPMNAI